MITYVALTKGDKSLLGKVDIYYVFVCAHQNTNLQYQSMLGSIWLFTYFDWFAYLRLKIVLGTLADWPCEVSKIE